MTHALPKRLSILILVLGLLAGCGLALWSPQAMAQTLSLDLEELGSTATARLIQIVAFIAIITLAPSLLVMTTSFTRIVVVLSFLRTALGTQQSPPTQVMIALALFMTLFIMTPTLERSYNEGLVPMLNEDIDQLEGLKRLAQPFHDFMIIHSRERDLKLFVEMAKVENVTSTRELPYQVVIPAFMISELRRAFEIGFLIFMPFLIIDMVVSSVLMAMGMMMLPPVMISVPFKLIFFVLVDGWYLIVGSLVQSYAVPPGNLSPDIPIVVEPSGQGAN